MVLDTHLQKQGTDYLVGDKLTYADLSFYPWSQAIPYAWKHDDEPEALKKMFAKHEAYSKWTESIGARDMKQ